MIDRRISIAIDISVNLSESLDFCQFLEALSKEKYRLVFQHEQARDSSEIPYRELITRFRDRSNLRRGLESAHVEMSNCSQYAHVFSERSVLVSKSYRSWFLFRCPVSSCKGPESNGCCL